MNPDLPAMGFVGFNSSFCTVLSAEMIANWLVRYADGQLARQPTAAQMNAIIAMMLNWERTERPAAQVYGGLWSAPFHFKHFDELLADMEAKKAKRGNPLAEQFSYPNAAAYGRFLASTPQYRAGKAAMLAPAQDWDEAFATMAHIPGSAALPGIWADKAAAYRASGVRLDEGIAYGPHPREVFDLVWPDQPRAGWPCSSMAGSGCGWTNPAGRIWPMARGRRGGRCACPAIALPPPRGLPR